MLQESIVEMDSTPSDTTKQDLLAIIKKLIITKQIFFPDDKRFVVSYEVKRIGSKLVVSAAALQPPTESNAAIANPD